MKAYYHARAHEYDDWWLGRGGYAERDRPGWDDKLAVLVEILRRLPPARTLDVACGTGYCHLLEEERVRFLDASPARATRASAGRSGC